MNKYDTAILLFVLFITIAVILISCKDTTTGPEPFSGITETGDISPEPIGNVDPDDWKCISDCPKPGEPDTSSYMLPAYTCPSPAYPNPATRTCTFYYSLATKDSVVVTLNDKPEHVIMTLVAQKQLAGWYSVSIDLSGLEPKIYRLYFIVIRPPYLVYHMETSR